MSGLLNGIGNLVGGVGGTIGNPVGDTLAGLDDAARDAVSDTVGGTGDEATSDIPIVGGVLNRIGTPAAEGNNAITDPTDGPGGLLRIGDLLNPTEPAGQDDDAEDEPDPTPATPAVQEESEPALAESEAGPRATLVATAGETTDDATRIVTEATPASTPNEAETSPPAEETPTIVVLDTPDEEQEVSAEPRPSASPTTSALDTAATSVDAPAQVASSDKVNLVPIVGASAGGLLFITIVAIVMVTRYRRRRWPFAKKKGEFERMEEDWEKGERVAAPEPAAGKWDPSSRISRFMTSKNF